MISACAIGHTYVHTYRERERERLEEGGWPPSREGSHLLLGTFIKLPRVTQSVAWPGEALVAPGFPGLPAHQTIAHLRLSVMLKDLCLPLLHLKIC